MVCMRLGINYLTFCGHLETFRCTTVCFHFWHCFFPLLYLKAQVFSAEPIIYTYYSTAFLLEAISKSNLSPHGPAAGGIEGSLKIFLPHPAYSGTALFHLSAIALLATADRPCAPDDKLGIFALPSNAI